MQAEIALLFGGVSTEHRESVASFSNVYDHLRSNGFRNKKFRLAGVAYLNLQGELLWSEVDFTKAPEYYLTHGEKQDLWAFFRAIQEKKQFVYSLLYSQNGDDGRMQGFAALMHIKGNFGNVLAASLCGSKYHFNRYVQRNFNDIHVPFTIKITQPDDLAGQLTAFRDREIVVKPNSLGSSIFTEKHLFSAGTQEDVFALIRKALAYDDVLVQEYINGTEYSCGCLELDGRVKSLPVVSVHTAGNFFGYPEKNDIALNKKALIPPAEESAEIKLIRKVSVEIFKDVELTNIARLDYIVGSGKVYLLETNFYPALTKYSFFITMLAEEGLTISDIIEFAYENYHRTAPRKVRLE